MTSLNKTEAGKRILLETVRRVHWFTYASLQMMGIAIDAPFFLNGGYRHMNILLPTDGEIILLLFI